MLGGSLHLLMRTHLVILEEPLSGRGERRALKGKRWFVLLGAALRWC